MEQKLLKFALLQLRIIAGILLAGLLSFLLLSFKTNRYIDDLWRQLGISKQEGSASIGNSFLNGYLEYWGARNIKNIASGDRVAIVKDLAAYAKQYVGSEVFKKEYGQYRISYKPQPPMPAKTLDQIRGEYVKALRESLTAMEGFQKSGNADLKKAADKALPDLQKQLKDAEDPNNKVLKIQADYEQKRFDAENKMYIEKTALWEKEYPADPRPLIKKRLQKFLDITADVDFDAELKEKGNKKFFVNPDYERKSNEWKQAFRAGKDVTMAARAFAEQWIKELK
jgi:hypothetical protein